MRIARAAPSGLRGSLDGATSARTRQLHSCGGQAEPDQDEQIATTAVAHLDMQIMGGLMI
jgi:hypothetical protein